MIKIKWREHEMEFPEHEVPKWAEDYVKQTYLLRDDKGKPCEELHQAYERVVRCVGAEGRLCHDTQVALDLLMLAGVFYPNVVFFMNAGTPVKNLAPCYSIKLDDTIEGTDESISEMLKLAMQIQTAGGGLGINFSPLRAKGTLIHSNKGQASGPCHFIRLFNALTDAIKAGGRRRGANLGVLSCHHPDIEEFVMLKDNPKGLENFNLSVRVDDGFMKGVEAGDKSLSALFDLICTQAWKTGDPGLLYQVALDRDNPAPEFGPVLTGNPCGEVLAPSPFACNLGSIDISKLFVDGVFRWNWFKVVVELGCYFLDAALDAGCYVGEKIQERMQKMRLVGLGIMGFADLLLKLSIRYGSEKSSDWALSIGAEMAVKAREVLPCSGIHLAFAPTGSLSALANCSSATEPIFAWRYNRRILTTGEEVEIVHPLYEKLVRDVESDHIGPIPDYFVTAHDVTPEEHVKVAAVFQKYVDGGVSKTVNLKYDATVDDVKRVFMLAWKLGCKGITVFRDSCRDEQMLKKAEEDGETAAKKALGVGVPPSTPVRKCLPDTRPGLTHKFAIGEEEVYLSSGAYDDSSLGEIFITAAKEGTIVKGLLDCFAIAISLCLQHGVPLNVLVRKFTHQRFEPSGKTSSEEIPFATSIVDYVFKWLDLKYGKGKGRTVVEGALGDVCPVCGGRLVHEAGCAHCAECGYDSCM